MLLRSPLQQRCAVYRSRPGPDAGVLASVREHTSSCLAAQHVQSWRYSDAGSGSSDRQISSAARSSRRGMGVCYGAGLATANVLEMFSVTSMDAEGGKVLWYDKPSDWINMRSAEAISALLANTEGKFVALDLYAGWCSCCRSAYPALCRIPSGAGRSAQAADALTLAKTGGRWQDKFHFIKANIEHEDIALFIKDHGVRGIPHILVFSPEGKRLIGFGASFKKMEAVRHNLEAISVAPSLDLVLDPEGHVVVRGGSFDERAKQAAGTV